MMEALQNLTIPEITLAFGAFWLSLLKLPKYEVNLWVLIASTLGKAFNRSITEEIEEVKVYFDNRMDEKMDLAERKIEEVELKLTTAIDTKTARHARLSILLFNDEILRGKKHSKQHFDNILKEIEFYDEHCNSHPEFENGVCDEACNNIKRIYKECLRTNDFLDRRIRKKGVITMAKCGKGGKKGKGGKGK